MRKAAIAAVILLLLGALVAFALLNLGRLVNRNKDHIIAQAEQAIGRKVAVEDIGVTVWGGIGVRLKNFALADDRTFSSQDFLRAADLQVNVAFLPLLRKELRVKRLILHQPVITVIRDKRGQFNFASLGRPPRPEGQVKPKPSTSPEGPAALPLLVSLVDVADGQVRYLDRKDGVELRISQLDLTVEDLSIDGPVSVQLAAAINADRQNVRIQGKIGPPPTRAFTDFKSLPIRGDITLGPVALADLKRLGLPADALPKDLSVDGPFSLSADMDGTLADLALQGKVTATNTAVRLKDRFQKPKGIPLLLSTDARVTKSKISLKKANITLHTLELSGTGTITREKTPGLRLTVDSIRGDLTGWEEMFPFLQGYNLSGALEGQARIEGKITRGRTPNINGSVSLTALRATLPQLPQPLTAQRATVTFTGQQAALKETPFRLGKSQFRLAADVERLSPLALTYRLSAPELWMADLRKDSGGSTKQEVLREAKSDGRLWTKNGTLAYRGKLSSARGTIADMDYTNLQANIALAERVATIKDLRLRAYNGSLQGRGRYDMRTTPPVFTLTSEARGMDVSAFFRSASAAGHIRGKANLDLTLAGSGNRWEEIQRGLSGQGQAEVLDGALRDVNIAEGALTGLTGVPGLSLFFSPSTRSKYPAIFGTQNTEFGQLKGSLNLRNGKVHLDNLIMAAADWAVRGKGWMTLDQTLALQARLVLSQQLSTDLIKDVKEFRYLADRQGHVVIPFALTGTLPGVKPIPDLAYVAGRLVSGTLFKQPAPPPRETPQTEQKSPASPPPAQPTEPKKTSPEEQFRKSLERIFGR
ncbi:MAG: AsmA family protein [Candidatus Methylomirabilales bacterium]